MIQTTSKEDSFHFPLFLQEEFPFKKNYYRLQNGQHMHFLAEGDAGNRPVLLVHGNPTWSFFYRNLIKELKLTHHVFAPDHIGCGLSDKPQNYEYTLEQHINNLEEFVREVILNVTPTPKKINLVVHDWGGAIGLGMALRLKDVIDRVVIMNTAAFTDIHIPKRINFCKIPMLGERLIRHFNAFAWPATFMAVSRPLRPSAKKGYLYPYNNYNNRIATARFVQDIPMNKEHPSWRTLKKIEKNLKELKGQKLILWGKKDFCFTSHFFERWKAIYPEAKYKLLTEAGHYLLEDEPEVTQTFIKNFFTGQ